MSSSRSSMSAVRSGVARSKHLCGGLKRMLQSHRELRVSRQPERLLVCEWCRALLRPGRFAQAGALSGYGQSWNSAQSCAVVWLPSVPTFSRIADAGSHGRFEADAGLSWHSRRTGGKGFGRTARMYVPEESHSGILPMNHSESGSGTVARRHSAPAATISHCFGAARYGAKKWPRSQGCVLEQYEFV